MFTLRPYQTKSKNGLQSKFKEGKKRLIFCLPTGGGKTVTFADMIHGATTIKGLTAMILCDRKELISQARDKVQPLGLAPTIIAPKYKQFENLLYLASVDTLRNRMRKGQAPRVDLIIVDEAHKQTFDKILKQYIEFCDPYIIGATATPLRTGQQNCLSEIYEDIVDEVSVQDLIDLGFLNPARTFAAKEDFSDIKKRGNDFDQSALFDKFNKTPLYDGVIENYNKFAVGKKAICFNVNVEHSKKMRDAFRSAGITAEHIDGNTPDAERARLLESFARGDFSVLCNCSVLTTGFDEPSIEVVIVNRATLSLPLWLQMCGRGSRLFDSKTEFIIIDQGANVYRHGLWEEEREWSIFKKPKRKGDGVAPVKLCQSCDAINHSPARVCKVCNEPFEIKKKELKQAEFVEVPPKRRRGFKATAPDAKTASMQELKEYGDSMGYKPGWAYTQLKRENRV